MRRPLAISLCLPTLVWCSSTTSVFQMATWSGGIIGNLEPVWVEAWYELQVFVTAHKQLKQHSQGLFVGKISSICYQVQSTLDIIRLAQDLVLSRSHYYLYLVKMPWQPMKGLLIKIFPTPSPSKFWALHHLALGFIIAMRVCRRM